MTCTDFYVERCSLKHCNKKCTNAKIPLEEKDQMKSIVWLYPYDNATQLAVKENLFQKNILRKGKHS